MEAFSGDHVAIDGDYIDSTAAIESRCKPDQRVQAHAEDVHLKLKHRNLPKNS